MNTPLVLGLVITVVAIVNGLLLLRRFRPRRLKQQKYVLAWKDLQRYCRDRHTWPDAVKEADALLEKALKRRKFRGKSMGERMVAAQRIFSNNDDLWFAHNLHKKLRDNPGISPKESDVKDALAGFRQALRDIGALPHGESKEAK